MGLLKRLDKSVEISTKTPKVKNIENYADQSSLQRDLPLPNVLRLIKQRFIEEDLHDVEDPNLAAYAEEYDIEFKLLAKVATRDNWRGLRNLKRDKWLDIYNQVEQQEFESTAHDLVVTQTKFIRESIEFAEQKLPMIVAELDRRINSMSDKDLLSYAKIILDMKAKFVDRQDEKNFKQKSLNQAHATGQALDNATFALSLGLKTHIVEKLMALREGELIPDSLVIEARETEKAQIFDMMDSKHNKALPVNGVISE